MTSRLPSSVRCYARPIRELSKGGYRLAVVGKQAIRTRLQGESVPPPVFVIGSGRSGTHWLGYILEAHPDIEVAFEQPPIFQWVTQMALDPGKERQLLPKLVRRYRYEFAAVAPRVFVDKSHPNIWLAEKLADAFPDARFIGIHRDAYGTVASMLKHSGVLGWYDSWRDYPVPNRFLGISEEMAADYDRMPLASKCAVRWQAHLDELRRLGAVLGPRLCLVSYEALQTSTVEEVHRIGQFLELRSPIPVPQVRTASLNRWESELGPETRRQIRDIVGDR